MKKIAAIAALLALSGLAVADEPDSAASAVGVALPSSVGSQLTPEQILQAQQVGAAIADATAKATSRPEALQMQQVAQNLARRADDIADASLSQQRDAALKFLGINPQASTALYYFVTYEMPLPMLRKYVAEAMWTSGTLIFKGVPKDMDLKAFIQKNLKDLVYGKGAAASISMDPRLFDTYSITVAPTIVYTTDRRNLTCTYVPKKFVYDKQELTYSTCPPMDPDKYWKISGAVTSDFALREFQHEGAPGVQTYLDALAKGLATGELIPREQGDFQGDWKPAISPADLEATKAAIDAARLSSQPEPVKQ